MADDIKKLIEESGEKTRKEIGALRKDIQDVGVLVEDVQSDVKHIAAAVDIHTNQLDQLAGLPDAIAEMKDDIEVIKVSVTLKHQFTNLENRVAQLEAKLNK